MSLRAIKKQQQQIVNSAAVNPPTSPTTTKANIFKKATTAPQLGIKSKTIEQNKITIKQGPDFFAQTFTIDERLSTSNPELNRALNSNDPTQHNQIGLVCTNSESDVCNLLGYSNNSRSNADSNRLQLSAAKSEVCLETISSHQVKEPNMSKQFGGNAASASASTPTSGVMRNNAHNCSTASYIDGGVAANDKYERRMSNCSSFSNYSSQRISRMSNESSMSRDVMNFTTRIPIIGYEVMEERARFTVYKLRVENPVTNDCWLVLRRYTDFVRLNNRIKQAFPQITLLLPRKKIFGDNFDSVFLDNRVQGLQIFVNSVMAKAELRSCKFVREFFCLDEPPSYSESMEECRAIFEAQEETIAHLKMQINSKNDLIINLQQRLRDEINAKEQLKETLKILGSNTCVKCAATIENV